eukprot:1195225-Prorocentrum_minimum.AAC.6
MLESGAKVRVDQAELETVIPVRAQLGHQAFVSTVGCWEKNWVIKPKVDNFVGRAGFESAIGQPCGFRVNIGGKVQVVNGAFRGQVATMVAVDVNNFSAKVQIKGGSANNREITLPYEDICKFSAYA